MTNQVKAINDLNDTLTRIRQEQKENIQNLKEASQEYQKTGNIGKYNSLQNEQKRLVREYNNAAAQRIRLLSYILTNMQHVDDNTAAIRVDGIDATNVLNDLTNHEFTVISQENQEAAYKNSVAAKIRNIVQNLRNMDQAYSPIEMGHIRKASESSPKGELTTNMTLTNPATKYIMQIQNMVGKNVIGIAAVGEKVFFTTSYYWNEGLRNGNQEWLRNMHFEQTFNRIQGRSQGSIVPRIVTTIADANFENNQLNRLFFLNKELREKYQIDTDSEVDVNSQQWKDYYAELKDEIAKLQPGNQYADLAISELLSSATDRI